MERNLGVISSSSIEGLKFFNYDIVLSSMCSSNFLPVLNSAVEAYRKIFSNMLIGNPDFNWESFLVCFTAFIEVKSNRNLGGYHIFAFAT